MLRFCAGNFVSLSLRHQAYTSYQPGVLRCEMLNRDERDYVVEVLSAHVSLLQSPRETVAAPFVGTVFPQLLRTGYPREIVIDAVRLCLEDQWTHQPPWLWFQLAADAPHASG